jgi:hypothetical protein
LADGDSYSALVRSADLAFPRGGRWIFFYWYAVGCAVFLWGAHISGDFALAVAAAMLLTAAFNVWIFGARGGREFLADKAGVTVAGKTLTWTDVAGLRISPIRRGALVEVLLSPAVPVAYRGPARQAADLAFLAFVPWRFMLAPKARDRWCPPAVRVPRSDPPRFVVPLLQVSPDDVRLELARLASGAHVVMTAR